MVDLAGIGTVAAAEDGDLEPLLQRLRSRLNRDEADWLERRLRHPERAKMRAGPKAKPDKRPRDLEIYLCNAWLRLTGWDKAEARNERLADAFGLKAGTIEKLLPTIHPRGIELLAVGMPLKEMADMVARGLADECKPLALRN